MKRYFAEHAEPGSGRSSRAAAPAADEFKPKIDLSHISKPGDVRKLVEQRAVQSSAVTRPSPLPSQTVAAHRDRRLRLRQLFLLQGQRLRLPSRLHRLRVPLP